MPDLFSTQPTVSHIGYEDGGGGKGWVWNSAVKIQKLYVAFVGAHFSKERDFRFPHFSQQVRVSMNAKLSESIVLEGLKSWKILK